MIDVLINWWLIGAASLIFGNWWYDLSQSKVEAVLAGFVAGFSTCFVLQLAGWL